MFDPLFLTINSWMTGGLLAVAFGCFTWGMVSVLFSPRHMASIPLIIGYVGGQKSILKEREALPYTLLFTCGLFITIAIIGIVCVLLGRMMGDVGPYWTLLLGGILIWVAMDMLGIAKCKMPDSSLARLQVTGLSGAFILGLALRYPLQFLYLWLHCPHPCYYYRAKTDRFRPFSPYPFRPRPLSSYCRSRQFGSHSQTSPQ